MSTTRSTVESIRAWPYVTAFSVWIPNRPPAAVSRRPNFDPWGNTGSVSGVAERPDSGIPQRLKSGPGNVFLCAGIGYSAGTRDAGRAAVREQAEFT